MPAATRDACAAWTTRVSAAVKVGESSWPGMPSDDERSAGPTNKTSTPASAAMASTFSSADDVSIWTISRRRD